MNRGILYAQTFGGDVSVHHHTLPHSDPHERREEAAGAYLNHGRDVFANPPVVRKIPVAYAGASRERREPELDDQYLHSFANALAMSNPSGYATRVVENRAVVNPHGIVRSAAVQRSRSGFLTSKHTRSVPISIPAPARLR